MKGKGYVLLTLAALIGVLASSLISMPLVDTRGKDAYIETIQYRSEMHVNEMDLWNLTVHNANCFEDNEGRARFFFKFYLDGQLFWDEFNDTTYKTWQCNKTRTRMRGYRIPSWSSLMPNWSPMVPATSARADFRVELYWYREDTTTLQDNMSFTVAYVSFIKTLHPMALAYLLIYSFMSLVLLFYLSPKLKRLVTGE